MKDWWQNLSLREQLIVAIGGPIAFILGFYWLGWQPFTTHVLTLHQKVIQQQTTLNFIQKANTTIQKLQRQQKKTTPINAADLLSVIDTELKKNNLTGFVNQISQSSTNKVKIDAKLIPFDQLIDWLTQMWQTYNIKTTELIITPTKKTGLVKATVVLELA